MPAPVDYPYIDDRGFIIIRPWDDVPMSGGGGRGNAVLPRQNNMECNCITGTPYMENGICKCVTNGAPVAVSDKGEIHTMTQSSTNSFIAWVQNNPLPSIAIAVGIAYLFFGKK